MNREKIFLQGFGFSGVSSIGDFVKEFDSLYLFKPEFDLCRAAGGIFELEKLVEDGSCFTHDSMIRRFMQLNDYLYHCWNMPVDFKKAGDEFIQNLILYKCDSKQRAFSISQTLDFPAKTFFERTLLRSFYNKWRDKTKIINNDKDIYYLKAITKSEYIDIARNYLKKVYDIMPANKKIAFYHTLSISEKIDTQLKYFDNYKVIFIDRDPRDIYFNMINNNEDYLKIHYNIDHFISFFKKNRKHHAYNFSLLGDKALFVKFEDFVLNYEATSQQIIRFLELDEKDHIQKNKYFNPNSSKKNIGLYKNIENKSNIQKIEKELAEYCNNVL